MTTLKVNGQTLETDATPETPLLWVLRDHLGLTGTKFGCGNVKQSNFDNYRVLRLNQMPELDLGLLDSSEAPGGIGEPSVALVAPALANAVFAATGKRVRALPLASAGLA